MDLEQTAIERLKMASHMSEKLYNAPLIVTTSGGKDSSVVVELARRSCVPFEVKHGHTTADAPETVRFVRSELARLEYMGIQCSINYPTYRGERISMWSLIPKMLFPPTRYSRYCCNVLKEQLGKNRFIVTGVRWSESKRRAGSHGIYETKNSNKNKRIILNNDNDGKRQLFETCQLKASRVCNPIIDWTDEDVWDFINSEKIPVNPLYSCGFSRVGCVGCPLASHANRIKVFNYWPKYKELYMRAFEKMIEERKIRGLETRWENAKEVYHWWMEDGVLPGQMEMEDFAEDA